MHAGGRRSCDHARPWPLPILKVCVGWCLARRHTLSSVICTVPRPTRAAVAEDAAVHRVRLIQSACRLQHARARLAAARGPATCRALLAEASARSGFKCSLSSVVRAAMVL